MAKKTSKATKNKRSAKRPVKSARRPTKKARPVRPAAKSRRPRKIQVAPLPKIKPKSNKLLFAILGILVIIAASWYFLSMDKTVAIVNGENVYQNDVNQQLVALQNQYGEQITKDMALNQTIVEKILLQEAKKKNIEVSDSELDTFITDSVVKSGSTLNGFKASLKEQNLTFDYVRERIRLQLTVSKLLKDSFSDVQVTEEEITQFYDENKALFSNQTLADIQPQIEEYLKSQKQSKEFQSYVLDLREKADVTLK